MTKAAAGFRVMMTSIDRFTFIAQNIVTTLHRYQRRRHRYLSARVRHEEVANGTGWLNHITFANRFHLFTRAQIEHDRRYKWNIMKNRRLLFFFKA
jgi:hypothetical protein